MILNRYQFEILTFLEKKGTLNYTVRMFSDSLNISGSEIEKSIDILLDNGLIESNNGKICITELGIKNLEPYRVKSAVIMAAGFGQRMNPATLNRPKPMVKVNGVRIIDTLIDALLKSEINDITIVRGYKKEAFDELLDKYPFIKFIDNDLYDKTDNIYTVILALDKIDGCYLCEADLYISNPDVITKYQYCSNILGSYSLETDDWCFKMDDKGFIKDFQKGNTYCYNEYGISFWTKEDSKKLRHDYNMIYNEHEDGQKLFWDYIPLVLLKDRYNVEIRQCSKSDIIEIDSYHELGLIDPSYR
ncbi:MAG: NTP transferase domain-containing protein [Clostridia bacterium]|nr:NTP transferase domain-containing protein [Clostridia bacterium]